MAVATIKQLLEAGVHFGHQTSRWNPKMRPYIFTARNGIHIMDLQKTVRMLDSAYAFVASVAASGRPVLFVGTKKQAQEAIQIESTRCGMGYVNRRWLGGMLTNFTTIQKRIKRMQELKERRDSGEFETLTKKEARRAQDELDRLILNFEGIAEMKRLPGVVYIVDPRKEHIAVSEANRLGIPVVAITDSNSDPDLIQFVIAGNDDAIRAVKMITAKIADACLEGRRHLSEAAVGEPELPDAAAIDYTIPEEYLDADEATGYLPEIDEQEFLVGSSEEED